MLAFLLSPVAALLGDNVALMGLVAVVLAGGGVVIVASHVSRKGNAVQRRLMEDVEPAQAAMRLESFNSSGEPQARFRRLIEAATPALDEKSQKVLQAKLAQAGIFDRKALALFFALRICGGILLGALVCGFMLLRGVSEWTTLTSFSLAGVIAGYMAPSFLLDRRIAGRQAQHRNGFPDVMDLMVVCSQAGLSMEAGIQRIAQELRTSYPSLALHLDLATLEIRGGKPMSGAIESLAKRLGIDEALSFATLLHQSEELGSSLTQSLRAYSDDMRNKRLMKAEEKAYALPAKLVVPLTLFIFPVLMMVLMLPVVVSVSRSGW